MPKRTKTPVPFGMSNRQMKRKKPINLDFIKKIEPLTKNQEEFFRSYELDQNIVAYGCAGTGKTSTVVGKVSYLVTKNEIKPNEILALAYGKDAAEEMRERVKEKTGINTEIRTFHALGKKIIDLDLFAFKAWSVSCQGPF